MLHTAPLHCTTRLHRMSRKFVLLPLPLLLLLLLQVIRAADTGLTSGGGAVQHIRRRHVQAGRDGPGVHTVTSPPFSLRQSSGA